MRRIVLPLLGLSLGLCLAACTSPPDSAGVHPSSTASYGPDEPSDITVSNPRVQLSAVPGRPAVAYFTISTSGEATDVVGVDVAHFARAEMHQSRMSGGMMTMEPVKSVKLTPGIPLNFAPGGYHVMLFKADDSVAPGQIVELTVTLANGDKISANARTVTMGEDMQGM